MPPITQGILAALFLFGPPLFGSLVTAVRKLRERRMVTCHHINGVKDDREKYYVEPKVWEEKTVEGPSPYTVNDGEAFEVREFTYHEDTGQLVVRGCYFSQMADSKFVTIRAMLEDVHGDLVERGSLTVEEYIDRRARRARVIKKMMYFRIDFGKFDRAIGEDESIEASELLWDGLRETDSRETALQPRAVVVARRAVSERHAG